MKPKNLYLLVGAPGSGKSYWATDLSKRMGYNHISRDDIRFSMLKDGDNYFTHEDEVFEKFKNEIQKSLDETGHAIADATHLNQFSRYKLLSQLKLDDVYVIAVKFDVPIELCLERNKQRKGRSVVPETALRKMHRSITDPYNDQLNTFDAVWYIDETGKCKVVKTHYDMANI